MKKLYSFFFAITVAIAANAQLTTNSNYDVNADGKVTVTDATATVSNYVSGDNSGERQVVDAAALNSVLKSIEDKLQGVSEIKSQLQGISEIKAQLQEMSDRLSAIEAKVGLGEAPADDPYNGHDWVDLGTGVKWATMNVGASSPDDYGDYFAWGETTGYDSGKDTFSWANYKWCNGTYDSQTKYCTDSSYGTVDNKKVLDAEDDAAHVNWGGNWRMPTKAEQDALSSQCYWKWVTTYNGKSVNGYIVYKAKADADKGKYSTSYSPSASYTVSDPHIFLPAAGCGGGGGLGGAGSGGYYWSSSLNESSPLYAYFLFFDSGIQFVYDNGRCGGRSVRAVCQ